MSVRVGAARAAPTLAELDAAAANAGGDVAKNWAAYKKQNAAADNGFLGSLGDNIGLIAGLGAVVMVLVFVSQTWGKSRSEAKA